MSSYTTLAASSGNRSKAAGSIAIGLLTLVLLYRAFLFAQGAIGAIRYPWELDYGEGIVWQQMRWMFTSKAYGPIDGFPAIVFHYPPLYHVVTAICAGAFGADGLATGRVISILSAVAAAVASSAIVDLLVQSRASRADRRVSAVIAALLPFTYLPVVLWAVLMRVDMLAIALDLFGLLAALRSLQRPRLIYIASLLFVAGVFTKQTALAAPVATFAVLLFSQPRLAMRGIAFSCIVGLTAFVGLQWLTGGGFYRHIFLYNINRLDAGRLWHIVNITVTQVIYVALACFVFIRRLADLRSRYRTTSHARIGLRNHSDDTRLLIAMTYLLVSTVMLLLVAKIGSNINYFLEWFYALGLFAAMAVTEGRRVGGNEDLRLTLGIALPITLAFGAFSVPLPQLAEGPRQGDAQQMYRLARIIASANKPVISDDMVVLIRGGQDVEWEPAIFRELTSTGRWDERSFIQRIRAHQFGFFVTTGDTGEFPNQERYSPMIAQAIVAEYPVREQIAGRTIHRPR